MYTMILASIFFLTFAYLTFRVIIKNDYHNHLKLSPLSYLLEIIVFAVHANMFYIFTDIKWPILPQLPESILIAIISSILLVIGLVILLIAWFGLGTKPSLGGNKDNLKIDGLYQYSRNPQLIGYGLILASFAFMNFSWLTLLWLLLYVVVSYFMVLSEEEFLNNKYKESYKVYCDKVPRVIKIF